MSAIWCRLKAIGTQAKDQQLTADKVSIGRKATNNIPIQNKNLSATHCSIIRESDQAFVEDSSTNGTYLNDTQISKGARMPVANGDKIWLLHPKKVKQPLGFEIELLIKKDSQPMDVENKQNELKRDERESEKEKKEVEKKSQEKKDTSAQDDLARTIKEQITCPMCLQIMFIPVTVHPCNHKFCGNCLTELVKAKKTQCIKCRTQITTAQRDSSINSIIDNYLKSHPGDKRSKDEEDEARKNNMFGMDSIDIQEATGNKKTTVVVDTTLLKSGRAPGVVLTSKTVPKKATKKKRKGSDLSAESDSDSNEKCRECIVARNGFRCSATQDHVNCVTCRKLMARRDDPSLRQQCCICEQYHCNLYYPPCSASGNKLLPFKDHGRRCMIDKKFFRDNEYESIQYLTYLSSKRFSAGDVFRTVLKDFVAKGQFRYLADKKILAVAPTVSREVTLDQESPICETCWPQIWFQIVMRHRMTVGRDMPSIIANRADCYYGINCRTMIHNAEHAKKLNHCCYQTRFH